MIMPLRLLAALLDASALSFKRSVWLANQLEKDRTVTITQQSGSRGIIFPFTRVSLLIRDLLLLLTIATFPEAVQSAIWPVKPEKANYGIDE